MIDTLLDILARGDSSFCTTEVLYMEISKFNFMNLIEKITHVRETANVNKDKLKKRIDSDSLLNFDSDNNFLVTLSKTLNLDL